MTNDPEAAKAHAVGINHVALEVGDIDAADDIDHARIHVDRKI